VGCGFFFFFFFFFDKQGMSLLHLKINNESHDIQILLISILNHI